MRNTFQHPYFAKTSAEQNRYMLYAIGITVMLGMLAFLLFWWLHLLFVGILICFILITLLAPFVDVPGMVKAGKLSYHSVFLLAEAPKDGVLNLHGGTLFDYVYVLDFKASGKARTAFILQHYLEGLLHLIATYEQQEAPLTLRWTSYIVNQRTAARLGFKPQPKDCLQQLILAFNYGNLLVSNSLAKGKLSFPKLSATQTYEASLEDLMVRKAYIKQLLKRMQG